MPVTFDQHLPRNQPTGMILEAETTTPVKVQFVDSRETQHGTRFTFSDQRFVYKEYRKITNHLDASGLIDL